MGKKRFLVSLLLIAILTSGIIAWCNYKYINGNYYLSSYGDVFKFQQVPEHITMANFGTSHGLAMFRYTQPDEFTTFNFALTGEDPYHDFQTLKQFSSHLDKGCIVTIPISLFSFCLPTDTPSAKRYYTYLDKEYIHDFSYEAYLTTKYVPVLGNIEFLFKDLINDEEIVVEQFMDNENEEVSASTTTAANSLGSGTQIGPSSPYLEMMERMLKEHAGTRADSWRYGRMVVGQSNMEENTKIYIDMVKHCYSEGFFPVVITPPIYYELRNEFSDEELEKYYYNNLHQVVEKTGVPYFDYSVDKQFIYNVEFYNNSDHMSQAGADFFYEVYKRELGQIKVTEGERDGG